ncbi:antiviral helicase Ski2p [Trichomonascus vanleenenianus]|uniref:SKI complex RNA helicase subunit SKI2 n=1 Tax=Trichomonascus vanleenenianus TaxID=2268995 RepID=UPI003EC9A993
MSEILAAIANARSKLDDLDGAEDDFSWLGKKSVPVTVSEDERKVAQLEHLTETYLTPKNTFSKDWLNTLQENEPVDKLQFHDKLFAIPDFQSRTTVKFKRSGLDGKIVGYEELSLAASSAEDAKSSLSMNRKMGSRLDFVRGRAGFMPFAPGGMDNATAGTIEESFSLHRDKNGLFDVPPTFDRGLEVKASTSLDDDLSGLNDDDEEESEDEGYSEDEVDGIATKLAALSTADAKTAPVELAAVDDLLPEEISFGRAKTTMDSSALVKAKEWAHVVDVNKKIENFDELVPNPARTYPFELDVFQKEAVYHLEQGDSVFVAAHTSAGKTVVAEYAMSMAQRNMTKVIYTSPIKALSNQKYRDFKLEYDDVGILTGDVQINPEASCLIMTTEILRSMLYRGADLIRDVEFVIFDEVHYVNDQDRGVVWEEVIIMLPDHIKFVLLSATVPNTYEFANWVGRTKQKDIYVISTAKRPVPLVNYLWVKGKKYEIIDANKKFSEAGYKKASDALMPKANDNNAKPVNGSNAPAARGGRGGSRGGSSARGSRGGAGNKQSYVPPAGGKARFNANAPGKKDFQQLAEHLHRNNLLPAVIFVFSKKRCEENALMLKGVDYCTAKEKSAIHMFIDKAVARLKKEDRELPQIMQVRDLLSRGIGVHHGGLLPIVKELIEILFAKSLVRILFATETFAMGLNLPTRTVVFASTRKHDGRTFRNLLPGEYTQMAGRAGRRGLDTTGTVIIMVQGLDPPPVGPLKQMTLGAPTKLQSQFRLTYNMILNLLRIEALKVEEMIKRSFSENATQVMLPEHEQNVKMNEDVLQKLKREPCKVCDMDIDKVHEAIVAYGETSNAMLREMISQPYGRIFLCHGRIIIYRTEAGVREMGIIYRINPIKGYIKLYTCAVAKDNAKEVLPSLTMIPGFGKKNLTRLVVAKDLPSKEISVDDVDFVTAVVMKTPSVNDILNGDKEAIAAALKQISYYLKFQSKYFDPKWKGKSTTFRENQALRQESIDFIANSECIKCPTFVKTYGQVHEEYLVKKKIQDLKQLISDQNLELLPDYEQRIAVLKDLGYIDENSNVQLKGRVACEISTGFELIITELVLDNFLGDYEPEEIVALLSCFVFEGNTKVETESVTPRLDRGKERILEIVQQVNGMMDFHQVQMTQEEAEFAERSRFGLMEAVYEWARGLTFHNITQLTDVQEGTIVRVITRLDEVCRQVMSAARIIGDAQLHEKMSEAQEKIKRDIVFCASLYI